jgi:hypothetical protein
MRQGAIEGCPIRGTLPAGGRRAERIIGMGQDMAVEHQQSGYLRSGRCCLVSRRERVVAATATTKEQDKDAEPHPQGTITTCCTHRFNPSVWEFSIFQFLK